MLYLRNTFVVDAVVGLEKRTEMFERSWSKRRDTNAPACDYDDLPSGGQCVSDAEVETRRARASSDDEFLQMVYDVENEVLDG